MTTHLVVQSPAAGIESRDFREIDDDAFTTRFCKGGAVVAVAAGTGRLEGLRDRIDRAWGEARNHDGFPEPAAAGIRQGSARRPDSAAGGAWRRQRGAVRG